MLVIGQLKDAERNVARPLLFGIVLLAKERPTAIDGSKEKLTRMAGVANREPTAGREKGGDDRSREGALTGERSELLVEEADEFSLVQAIHKAAHQGAQIGCRGSHGFTVTGNIGEEQAADTTGGATRDLVDISATLSLAEWFAVDPDIETGQFDSTGGDLAASPDLHALHMLCGGSRHVSIITAERKLN
jgi:hypothetical protein